MEFDAEKECKDTLIGVVQFGFFFGIAVVLVGYAGTLWTKANAKESALAQCEEMLPNAVVDCPLAAQVAECNVKYPWATCETTR